MRRSMRAWTAFCVALTIALFGLGAWLSGEIRLTTSLILPPLVAGLTTPPRRTAAIAIMSVFAAFLTGVFQEQLASTDHLVRVAVIALAATLAVRMAVLRERDLRTRRRVRLINDARARLESADGLEADLRSFIDAVVDGFADWAFLDIRAETGEATRVIAICEGAGSERQSTQPRSDITSAATAYAMRAHADGPTLLHRPDPKLIESLFAEFSKPMLKQVRTMVVPVAAGDVKATYFLIAIDPYPPWGDAELTQAESLARAAALAGRADRLIDQLSFAHQELRESRDQIEAIVGNIADGVLVQSRDGTIVYANMAGARMLGFEDPSDVVGLHYSEVPAGLEMRDERGNPVSPDHLPSRRVLAGESRSELMLNYVIQRTGREYWVQLKTTAVQGDDGSNAMAVTVVEDITDRRREERAQRFLADAGKALGSALDTEPALRQIADAAVPAIADWVTIDLLEPDGSLRNAAIAHADHRLRAELSRLHTTHTDAGHLQGPLRVAQTGAPELHHDSAPRQPTAGAVPSYDAPAELKPRSLLIAPIAAHGRTLGAITMALTRAGSAFNQFDLSTTVELGRRAGVALENAALHHEREHMLETLQRSLLPDKLPRVDGLELAGFYRPATGGADVGGDFYDVFSLPDGSTAAVIGDVCGKGAEAAALTARVRYTLRTIAMTEPDPLRILTTLNGALIEQVGSDRFCTMALARLRPTIGGDVEAEIVCAGHPPPLRLGNGTAEAHGHPGTLLGVVEEPDLSIAELTLRPGQALVLYTDGISAGRTTDDARFALELVETIPVESPAQLAADLGAVCSDAGPRPNRDDLAILVAAAR